MDFFYWLLSYLKHTLLSYAPYFNLQNRLRNVLRKMPRNNANGHDSGKYCKSGDFNVLLFTH
jgi:hypothetical protein